MTQAWLESLIAVQSWRGEDWWGGAWVSGNPNHDGAVELFMREYWERREPHPMVYAHFGCGAWLGRWARGTAVAGVPDLAWHSEVEDHLVFARNLMRFSERSAMRSQVGVFPDTEGLFGACIRIYRDMGWNHRLVNVLAGRLPPRSPIHLFGKKEEGIVALEKRLRGLGADVEVRAVGCHARWIAVKTGDWALPESDSTAEIPGLGNWRIPEGVFASGRLDPGTALLLDHLGNLAGAQVWDFGCGSGVIAAYAAERGAASVLATDHSALAIDCAQANLERWSTVKVQLAFLSDGVKGEFDLILSNPPFHRNGRQDAEMGRIWLAAALRHLVPDGEIRLVCNSFLPYPVFARDLRLCVSRLAERHGYTVYGIRRENMV